MNRPRPCAAWHAREFPIEHDVLRLNAPLEGNNAIAAEYYNSTLWPKFRFWEWVAHLPRGGERKARNEVLGHLKNLSGTRLLEVAIGDGRNLPLVPRDCQMWGVDISGVLLEKCRRDYADRDLYLILGEAETLPFADATFENVCSVGALNHVNDPTKMLSELARVVKPDGLVVVADEMPDLPNRQIAHKLGMRNLQRWILSRVFFLGPKMSEVILEHTNLKIEPIVEKTLRDWRILPIWGGVGYCVVGKPKLRQWPTARAAAEVSIGRRSRTRHCSGVFRDPGSGTNCSGASRRLLPPVRHALPDRRQPPDERLKQGHLHQPPQDPISQARKDNHPISGELAEGAVHDILGRHPMFRGNPPRIKSLHAVGSVEFRADKPRTQGLDPNVGPTKFLVKPLGKNGQVRFGRRVLDVARTGGPCAKEDTLMIAPRSRWIIPGSTAHVSKVGVRTCT